MWLIFLFMRVLTLDDAIELALQNNKELLAEREKIHERRYEAIEARGNLLPQVKFDAGYVRLSAVPEMHFMVPIYTKMPIAIRDPVTGQIIAITDSVPIFTGMEEQVVSMGKRDNYSIGISISQPIFTWGKLYRGYEIAKIGLEIERQLYAQKEAILKLQVKQTFFQALLAKEMVKVAQKAYEEREDYLRVVERQYANGEIPEINLLQARCELLEARQQLMATQNNYELVLNALKNIIGVPITEEIDPKGELHYDTTAITLDEALQLALKNRAEVKMLELSKEASTKALEIARASNKPNLILTGSYEYQRPYHYFEDKWGKTWNITVALSWPIFDGLKTYAQIRKAEHALKATELSLNQVVDAIKLEVQQYYLKMRETEKQLTVARENLKLAEQTYEMAQTQYKEGIISDTKYREIRLMVDKARLHYLQVLAEFNIAKAGLEKAIGEAL